MPRGLLHGGTPHARERHTCRTNGAQTAKSKRLMCVCIDVYLCIRRSSTLWIWPLALWDRVSAWPVGWLTRGNTLTRPGNPRDVYTVHTHASNNRLLGFCVSFHTTLLFECSNFVGVRCSYMLLRFFCSNNHRSQQSHLSYFYHLSKFNSRSGFF